MSDMENCCKCQHSEIFDKPMPYTDGIDSGDLFGYCHKNGGKYKIFLPGGKCKNFNIKEGLQVDEELRKAIEEAKEQQAVAIDLKWYADVKLSEIKQFIRAHINTVSRTFVSIGYYLKYIRDKQLYKDDGYTGILDFAKAEFGISAAQASKFMSINDKFSVDGNSPILLEQYREFSSSKLSEMLYLTDEQLEQVTVATTNVEIREIKKPVKNETIFSAPKMESEEVAPAQQKPEPKKPYYQCAAYQQYQYSTGCSGCFYDKADCPYDRIEYFDELKRKEEWAVHCEVLKEMCNSLCLMNAFQLEQNKYSMSAIQAISTGEYGFGFGDDGTGHSKYQARLKNSRYKVSEFSGSGSWTFNSGSVDQQIWNFNGRDWHKSHPVIDKQTETVNDTLEIADIEPDIVDEQPEAEERMRFDFWEHKPVVMKCSNCNYDTMSPDAYFADHPDAKEFPCNNCDDKLNHWVPKIEGMDNSEDEPDPVETVEADIVQAVSEEKHKPLFSEKYQLKELIKHEEETLAGMRDAWTKNNPDALRKHELMLLAYKGLLIDMEYPNPEPQKPVHPELPVLKNNDQRKDFIDAYKNWPVWIDVRETGERYYRYNFDNGESFVIRVHLEHKFLGWDKGGYSKTETEYGREEYWLLRDGKLFSECGTNKSLMVDYLKDLQKK
jgi:hypothetical protein